MRLFRLSCWFSKSMFHIKGVSITIWIVILWLAKVKPIIDIINYRNNNIILKWLQNFINSIQNKRRDTWLFFIIDGYSSYIIILFYNLATKNKIVFYHLLLHFIFFTQFLDIRVFQPIKHYYTNAIDKAIWSGNETFGKPEFLAAF